MGRPAGIYGTPAPYLPSVGQTIYDTPLADLPPVTAALRAAWGNAGSPTPSGEAMAALLVAVHALETRVAALEDA
jgi:hypothetical protein